MPGADGRVPGADGRVPGAGVPGVACRGAGVPYLGFFTKKWENLIALRSFPHAPAVRVPLPLPDIIITMSVSWNPVPDSTIVRMIRKEKLLLTMI